MMTSSNGNIFRLTGPLCGEFTGPGEFPTQRPVTRSFYVFFHLRLNKRLSKQSWGWWFETAGWSLWRHRNEKSFFLDADWRVPLRLGTRGGPKCAKGQNLVWDPMFANTVLFFAFIIWWHSKLGIFLIPPLTKYADNFVNLIMQPSLLGRQASCFQTVMGCNNILSRNCKTRGFGKSIQLKSVIRYQLL